ncbi:hypothetical protein SALWKB2_1421 [Snodgrassella alvi wkB2]|uniref:Uncharacterized protein n=1 Tax=Snodgrassella alvi TaxID=1196083 RepID=A0ABD7Z049_9NEIS|nr:hypothetical protein [Snodgrassella alvi]AHN28803.1 hypothetical protein SALWKB2_1421 [Snodgrassella alvi wkB2]ORF09504.1 hypothetical protein BGH96_00145 [Snodgrassella alvi]PIT45757.1 hypothetical protein BHC45_05305 [Snodgrassella alvi]PIT67029.1 hypothetical protein BHC52_00270 [Snodgrassella alvi]UOO98129.1 hypothetical protein LVJ87_08765 [Snodgrassella alvi wkB2]
MFELMLAWILIGIILIILILLYCLVKIIGKVQIIAKNNPKKTKYIVIVLSMILIIAGGFKIKKLYYERPPYRFWYELLEKNSKPFYISQNKFEEKNREGYCWRDRTYYTKKELWHKAMKSLIGKIIYENKLYWENKMKNMDGQFLLTYRQCTSSDNCRVWQVPVDLTNQKLNNYIGVQDNYLDNINELIKLPKVQTFIYDSDKNYINYNFGLEKFILIHRKTSEDSIKLYGSDCCTVYNKSEWQLMKKRKNYVLAYKESIFDTFVEESRIPPDEDINSLGVGNYYFGIDGFLPKTKTNYYPINYPYEVFYLNNCGDILYKPYFYRTNKI